jgi:hypothetical protein
VPRDRDHPGPRSPTGGVWSGIIKDVNDELAAVADFGPEQPQRFLSAWFGPPSRDAPQWVANGLPLALVEWHRQVARWDSTVTQQNRVPFERRMDGDMLLVGIENQEVWLWGVPDDGDNPMVWERENTPGADWTETGEHLDEFLWHFTLVEATLNRYYLMAFEATPADHNRFTRGWINLGVKPWRWPGPNEVVWTRDGLIAWTVVNDRPGATVTAASHYAIVVGARSYDDLVHADNAGIDWAWDSRTQRWWPDSWPSGHARATPSVL